MLFSLETLSAAARATPAAAPTTTESSSLIDIRALCTAAAKADVPAARAEAIINLGSGTGFAPLLAPPLASSPSLPPETRPRSSSRRAPLIALAAGAAFIALTTIVSLAITRPASANAKTTPTATTTTAASTPPSMTPPATTATTAATETATPPAKLPATTAPATTVATARPKPRVPTPPATATTQAAPTPAPAPAAKCCPGESDLACHMRISTGGKCG